MCVAMANFLISSHSICHLPHHEMLTPLQKRSVLVYYLAEGVNRLCTAHFILAITCAL